MTRSTTTTIAVLAVGAILTPLVDGLLGVDVAVPRRVEIVDRRP